ncbi:MAG: GIY-YIG nuclease family protein [Candidatus Aenigmarchaeota archaeon]|nr:GIY-YIG nuclease family protein [Candidatus Aenigmarchaeota archaeon]MDI6721961.1 GIY-YIG nuclease family protein [Candidatus Aenigmarchaeota archaeon]
MKGSYILLISVRKDSAIRIGKLGSISFPKGFYCYVGSAMNSLENRVNRHYSKEKKLRWHIDYLLSSPHVFIRNVLAFPSENRMECDISQLVKEKADRVVRKFGSSDCRCEGHLYYFRDENAEKVIANLHLSK